MAADVTVVSPAMSATRRRAPQDAEQSEEEPLVIAGMYVGTKAEQKARAEAAIRWLDELAEEEDGDDLYPWPELKKALNENRRAVGARLLFPDEEQ